VKIKAVTVSENDEVMMLTCVTTSPKEQQMAVGPIKTALKKYILIMMTGALKPPDEAPKS
jgi:hypothetical protein